MTDSLLSPTAGATPSTATPLPDPATERTRAVWTAGDFGRIAVGYAKGAADFVNRLALARGERVLDVACGTGNLSIPAARAGARTTGIDIAPNLIAQAVSNAAAEGLAIRLDVGDAEALPYADASFDATITMFGAMFAARPERAAAELLRVTHSGGRIAMANWTPTGFVGRMLKIVGSYVAPPAGVPSTLLWGDEPTVRDRLTGVAAVRFVRRRLTFEYPCSPAETVRMFRDFYGPTVRAFGALDLDRQRLLERDLVALWRDQNLAGDGTTRVESEYLEVIAIR